MGVAGKKAAARTGASRDRDADVYDRYAVALYRQALLAFGDEGMAGHALSALRRCQELAAGHNRGHGSARPRTMSAARASPSTGVTDHEADAPPSGS
jgi:hypothetical protein